jgi:hypothetical protein
MFTRMKTTLMSLASSTVRPHRVKATVMKGKELPSQRSMEAQKLYDFKQGRQQVLVVEISNRISKAFEPSCSLAPTGPRLRSDQLHHAAGGGNGLATFAMREGTRHNRARWNVFADIVVAEPICGRRAHKEVPAR